MSKDEFQKVLEKAGFSEIVQDGGVVTAIGKPEDYEQAKTSVREIAKKEGYNSSFGVRMKH